MIYTGLNRAGEIVDVKAHGGGDVAEVYGSIGELNPVYYKLKTITGTLPLSYKALGKPLSDYLISGNTVQNGTPTPEAPVDVVGCGVRTGNLLDRSSDIVGYRLGADGSLFAEVGYETSQFIQVTPNSVIRRNKPITINRPICEYDKNQEFISRTTQGLGLTLSANTHYIRTAVETSDTNVMLNLGSTALPYEPYGYKLPLTINSTEYPIYLGEAESTRRVKKLVLTGDEEVYRYSFQNTNGVHLTNILDTAYFRDNGFCSHYPVSTKGEVNSLWIGVNNQNLYFVGILDALGISTSVDFKSYLAAQYAAGTPVTVWYVLAEPETAVVNEPLMKIGDYADTVSMAQAGATIPTVAGANTLTIDTAVQPSEISITGNIKEAST